MKKLPLLALTALSTIGILWACGGDDSGDDSFVPYEAGADAPIKFDTGPDSPDPAQGQGTAFCDATLGLIRTALTTCCSPAEVGGLQLDLYKNINTYVTKCEQTLESSIAQHRTAPTSQDFEACENGFKAVFGGGADGGACGGLDEFRIIDVLSPSCVTAFTGKGADGDKCAGDFDCGNDLRCIGYGDGTDGTCQTPAPANGTCGPTGTTPPVVDFVIPPQSPCASSFYCTGGTCQTQATLPDSGCISDPSCNTGLCIDQHCSDNPSPGPRLSAGDYCHTSEDCNTGLFCDQSVTLPTDGDASPGATGVCKPSKGNGPACAQNGNAGVDHECLGKCSGTCVPQCTFP